MSADASEAIAEICMMVREQLLEPISEAVAGYRQVMVAKGFSDPVAEQMALQYHVVLLDMVNRGVFRGVM